MKINNNLLIWGLFLFLSGALMAEHAHGWTTIKDLERGVEIDFPHSPTEMTFDSPFQNTPAQGQIHFYSALTETGLLVLATFQPVGDKDYLQKEQLQQFFETFLVPHCFYNPAIFQNQQIFNFLETEFSGQKAASFQFFFQDQNMMKKLEGIAWIKENILYIPFYLSSEKEFDAELLHRFLHSIQLPKSAKS